jgi:hypothetical protein
MALAQQLSIEGRRIALVLSSLALTDTDGWEAMTAVRAHHPAALRVVYLQPGDRDEAQLVQRPLQMRLADHYVVVPMVSPDETFHATISELLGGAGLYGEQLEIAQLIGDVGSARMHQLRDLAGRNGVAIGVLDARSEDGQRVLSDAGLTTVCFPYWCFGRGWHCEIRPMPRSPTRSPAGIPRTGRPSMSQSSEEDPQDWRAA